MISAKKLIQMASKWQKLTAIKQKRIKLPRIIGVLDGQYCCRTCSVMNKGHFVVWTADHKRFVLPLKYLNKDIFRELLRMAEEEFGLPRNGPITLPCTSAFLEHVIALIQQYKTKDFVKYVVNASLIHLSIKN